jgi:hypothetical protein
MKLLWWWDLLPVVDGSNISPKGVRITGFEYCFPGGHSAQTLADAALEALPPIGRKFAQVKPYAIGRHIDAMTSCAHAGVDALTHCCQSSRVCWHLRKSLHSLERSPLDLSGSQCRRRPPKARKDHHGPRKSNGNRKPGSALRPRFHARADRPQHYLSPNVHKEPPAGTCASSGSPDKAA